MLEERLHKLQVSHKEPQKTGASRLETNETAVKKKNNHPQDAAGAKGCKLLNIQKQLDGVEGVNKSSKDTTEFLKKHVRRGKK